MQLMGTISLIAIHSELATGHPPTKLYLGIDEWEEVKRIAETMCFKVVDLVPDATKRAEVQGMKLFKVDAQSHISVGV